MLLCRAKITSFLRLSFPSSPSHSLCNLVPKLTHTLLIVHIPPCLSQHNLFILLPHSSYGLFPSPHGLSLPLLLTISYISVIFTSLLFPCFYALLSPFSSLSSLPYTPTSQHPSLSIPSISPNSPLHTLPSWSYLCLPLLLSPALFHYPFLRATPVCHTIASRCCHTVINYPCVSRPPSPRTHLSPSPLSPSRPATPIMPQLPAQPTQPTKIFNIEKLETSRHSGDNTCITKCCLVK